MLQIRQEQMDEFEKFQFERFVREALKFARETWSEEFGEQGEEAARELILDSVNMAETYNIDQEDQVLAFLNMRYALGSEFPDSDEFAWALAILEDDDLDGDEKIERLDAEVEKLL